MKMPQFTIRYAGLAAAIGVALPAAYAQEDTGTVSLNLQLRPRYEFVNQDGKADDANAVTNRTLLGITAKPLGDIGFGLQFSNVSRVGDDDFNDTANGKTTYPLVPDPDMTTVTQAYLEYAGVPSTKLRVGRQIIDLDNQRFVGKTDWRQTMSTFDAVSIENRSLDRVRLFAAYADRTNASYANGQLPAGSNLQDVENVFVNAAADLIPGLTLTAYGYQYEDETQPAFAASNLSSRTVGLRINGFAGGSAEDKPVLLPTSDTTIANVASGIRWLYTLEYARQSDHANGRRDIDNDYYQLGAGIATSRFLVRVDNMVLGANDAATYGLQTPTATKHPLNGWADMFLVTPATGLNDLYLTAGYKFLGMQLIGVAHDYRADAGSAHFGSEVGAMLTRPFGKRLTGALKYAEYRADEGEGAVFPGTANLNVDTRKAWLFATYTY